MKAVISWSCFVTKLHGSVAGCGALCMAEETEEHQAAKYQHAAVKQMEPGLHGSQQFLMTCLQLVELISRAACVGRPGTCGLEHMGIFLVHGESCNPPGPDMWLDCGIPMAHQQGAEGVCTAIGDLVQRRIFPALKEVCIAPALCEPW